MSGGSLMARVTFDVLESLVAKTACKPGWEFKLIEEGLDLRLVITVPGYDSHNPKQRLTVRHFFPVPAASYNEKTWRRWIFERCRGVENHELGEWFRIDGERPFAPLHGPGEDPYTIHEFRDLVDANTNQYGEIAP
jgi:hypothetical protein